MDRLSSALMTIVPCRAFGAATHIGTAVGSRLFEIITPEPHWKAVVP